MRILIILLLSTFLSCQSAVRYTSGRELTTGSYGNGTETTGHSENTQINQSGSIDQSTMGKIIAGYLRTPYQLGGTGKLGIDCSGLVYVVYRDYNSTRLPKNTDKLYHDLKRVDYQNCHYGDLLFFSFDNTNVSHVGIYVGNNKFVHASQSRGVIISSMNEDYYRNNYKGARRVIW